MLWPPDGGAGFGGGGQWFVLWPPDGGVGVVVVSGSCCGRQVAGRVWWWSVVHVVVARWRGGWGGGQWYVL